jgi:hypothetical protein
MSVAAKQRVATMGEVADLLEKLLIVTMALSNVPQRSIREVVERDLNRVSKIVKNLKGKTVKGEA